MSLKHREPDEQEAEERERRVLDPRLCAHPTPLMEVTLHKETFAVVLVMFCPECDTLARERLTLDDLLTWPDRGPPNGPDAC